MNNLQSGFFELPNFNLKVIKSSENNIDSIDSILVLEKLNKIFSHIDFDVLLIISHIFLKCKNDGFIYTNTDEILSYRGIKKIKQTSSKASGYKNNVREIIRKSLLSLKKTNIISVTEYKKFNFIICFNNFYFNDKRKIKIPSKILNYNPHKKPWHKDIGYFLTFYKYKKPGTSIIQIKKILKYIKKDYSFLAPNEIRIRFEDVMDTLAQENVIANWHYKNIDEDFLSCKNWLYYWQILSVKIDFDILAKPPSFLNF